MEIQDYFVDPHFLLPHHLSLDLQRVFLEDQWVDAHAAPSATYAVKQILHVVLHRAICLFIGVLTVTPMVLRLVVAVGDTASLLDYLQA